MPQFSRNNAFEFGYNRTPFSLRKSTEDRYFLRFAPCTDQPGNFRDECLRAAREIYATIKRPPSILMSGGVDSEVVAESFRVQGIPFRAIIFKFEKNLNQHDVEWAIKYVQDHKVNFEIIPFDIVRFYKSEEIKHLAQITLCPYPMLITQAKMVDFLQARGDFALGGGSDPRYRYINNQWLYFTEEYEDCAKRLQIIKGFSAQVSFFLWRSEIFYAHASDPFIEKIFSVKNPEKTFSYQYKHEFLKQHFNVKSREKFRGYEKFTDLHQNTTQNLIKLLGHTYDEYFFWTRESLRSLWSGSRSL